MNARVATLDYDRFDVSPRRGFVPDTDPLTALGSDSHSTLRRLDELGATLPERLDAGTLRETLFELEVPPTGLFDDLSRAELLHVYRLAGFLANVAVHSPEGRVGDTIPAGVAVPLYESTARLGRTPVLSYDGYVLHNWARVADDGGFRPDNLDALTTFVDLPDETWFIAIHVAIETAAGPAIGAIGEAQAAVRADDADGVHEALVTMTDAIATVDGVLARMPERNAPENYGHTFRHYLKPLVDVEYAGVDELDGPQSFRGASGAQSSLFPALDAALGVDHGDNPLVSHLRTLRADMPPEHKAFIAATADGPSIHEYVAGDERLVAAYNACLDRMVDFRDRHTGIVSQYLTAPLGEDTGTGGTPHGRFLDMFTTDTADTRL
ncbi:indoleamine 2,3-dioxygenase [Halogranum gelatinilyticum]|uniref:Indoleamine 2,3-dioxygenase n=1 Tax=Halogranum gelatinilyticum TaxID=660521 RepID=A0A1G9XG59_9EURY|nr:indoleamine 2,3-dioxygenase [Halogranum gelatinilyticum]SDM95283.1 indoleamine 2,3-dioxygenase [Halogranum gelatinilyticum]